VARRATVIKDMRKEEGRTVLVLDAGDALLGQPVSLQTEGAAIVEAMNAMGYDAMAVGQLDLAKGIDVLVQRAQEARFAILSCNLVRKGTRELILRASTVIERDGVRYGILGVTEPEAVQSPGVADVADILDPIEAVRAALPDLQARSDVVIVLSHLGIEGDHSLAQAVSGIDIIVGGRDRELMRAPQIEGNTVIVQNGYDGEFLGRLDVTVNQDGTLSDPVVGLITLTPDYADDPELAALVARYKDQYLEPTRPAS
jgi:2',3'-cyclic-nucleotide 2'-phosphodiesterase (5'-nucleotidase family)